MSIPQMVTAVNTRTGRTQDVPAHYIDHPAIFDRRFQPLPVETPSMLEEYVVQPVRPRRKKRGNPELSRQATAGPADTIQATDVAINPDPGEAGESTEE